MPEISFDPNTSDLDTFGHPDDYKMHSNLEFRQGNRTKKEHARDLSVGVKRQVKMMEKWFDGHCKIHGDCPVTFLDVEFLDKEGKIDEGNFRDGLDAILTLRIKDKDTALLIELDCVEYHIPFARFKQRKIRRNLKRNAPIVYGHMNWGASRLFVFSFDELTEMDKKETYVTNDPHYRGSNPDGVYDGHPYYLLDVQDTCFTSINFSTLSPVSVYKTLINKLISRKTK